MFDTYIYPKLDLSYIIQYNTSLTIWRDGGTTMLYFAFTAHHVNIWRQTSWLVSRINQNILKWNL